MAQNIVLCIEFEIENMDFICYRLTTMDVYQNIREFLTKCRKYSIQPYCNPSPREYIGDSLTAESLLNLIKIIDAPEKVNAFHIFHGISFSTGDNILAELFRDYIPDLSLYNACSNQNLDMVDKLIKLGVNDYNEGLKGACQIGNLELVQMMIDEGADNFTDGLTIVCSNKHYVIMAELAKADPNINHDSADWNAGLNNACVCGDGELVQAMVDRGANNLAEGFTMACQNKQRDLMILLANEGADATPALKQMCQANLSDMVEYLLTEYDDVIDWSETLAFACPMTNSLLIKHCLKHGVTSCQHCGKDYTHI